MRWTVCCQRPLLNLGLRRVGGNGEKPSSAAITAALHLIIAESAAHKPSSRHQRALPQRPMPSTITRAPMHSSLNDTSDEIHLLRPRTLIKGTRRRDRRCRRRRWWRRGRGRWAVAATAVAALVVALAATATADEGSAVPTAACRGAPVGRSG